MISRKIPAVGEPMPEFYLEKDAVAFLIDDDGEPIGTAFFVRVLYPEGRFEYLVTAAHNVIGYEDETKVRLRLRSGGVEDLDVHRWVPHEDEAVDVAVAPVQISPMTYDYQAFRLSEYLIDPWEPGDGTDVYYIGLLGNVEQMGKNNIPMVRSGTLGAWEQEGVPWRDANSTRGDPNVAHTARVAHLVDVRSHTGFSGSPCLAYERHYMGEGFSDETQYPSAGGMVRAAFIEEPHLALIGLISGHFPHSEKALTSWGEEIKVKINAGVAVVSPGKYIAEVLEMDKLAGDRTKRAKEAGGQRGGMILDSSREEDEGEVTRKGFHETLDRATDRLESSDEEKA